MLTITKGEALHLLNVLQEVQTNADYGDIELDVQEGIEILQAVVQTAPEEDWDDFFGEFEDTDA